MWERATCASSNMTPKLPPERCNNIRSLGRSEARRVWVKGHDVAHGRSEILEGSPARARRGSLS
jgi:hypothetical protein